jgi:hypothetical protein
MKTASKVLIIISMVLAAVGALTTILVCSVGGILLRACQDALNEDPSSGLTVQELYTLVLAFIITGCVLMVASVEIVGPIALHKLAVATSRSELIGIGVCTLIFCSTIGGILMLCIPDSEFTTPVVEAK